MKIKRDMINKKNLFLGFLAVIFLVGIFFRSYNFSDWLHFELDQSRDAKVVGLALEQGIGNLPLLGPKAAGSFLRLGPLFYYTEYLSGLIFGNTPAGLAGIFLIFSCLTPVIFYLFIRRYFDKKVSVMLLAIFSASIFLIMYSRFAWNPNNIPFFILLFFYALLRVVDIEEKKKGLWLLLASLAFSFASQLHFVVLLSLPVIAIIFLSIKRPKISWKFWVGAFLILIFFYLPPIINDFKTGGENIAEFQKMFVKKSSNEKSNHTLSEKIIKSFEETSMGYLLVYSGYQKAELPKLEEKSFLNFDVKCDQECRTNLPFGVLAFLIFVSGVILGLNKLFRDKEKGIRKDFLILIAIYLITTLGLFVPIAYDLAPRFFLLVAPLAFIFLGLIFDFFKEKKVFLLTYLIVLILILSNFLAIKQRFSEMARASQESFEIESDKILKERHRVTLEQQLMITNYIENIYEKNKFPVYINSEAFYRRAFLYHLEQKNIPRDDFRNTGKNIYAQGNYFLIYPSNNTPEEISEKYLDRYFISEVKYFGTLTIVRVEPLPEFVNTVEQEFGPEKKPTSASGVPVRCRWNEILGKCNQSGLEENED